VHLREVLLVVAWKVAQWFLSAVSAQAFLLAGASPKYSATAALVLGETMWSMNL
jgi:hypothetical protein